MCQPACRGGNKRSRNTSNPTLICPYRSTMVSQTDLFSIKEPSIRGLGLRCRFRVRTNSTYELSDLDFISKVSFPAF